MTTDYLTPAIKQTIKLIEQNKIKPGYRLQIPIAEPILVEDGWDADYNFCMDPRYKVQTFEVKKQVFACHTHNVTESTETKNG